MIQVHTYGSLRHEGDLEATREFLRKVYENRIREAQADLERALEAKSERELLDFMSEDDCWSVSLDGKSSYELRWKENHPLEGMGKYSDSK